MTLRFFSPFIAVSLMVAAPAISFAQPGPQWAPKPGPQGGQMRDVVGRLSPQGQAVFRDAWLNREKGSGPQRHAAARAAEDQVFAAMGMEPFDAEALRHAYADQRAINANNQKLRQEHLVDVLKRLSPADRHILVDQLRTIRERVAPPPDQFHGQ